MGTYSHWLDATEEMKRNSNATMNWKSGTALKNTIAAVRAVSLSGKVRIIKVYDKNLSNKREIWPPYEIP